MTESYILFARDTRANGTRDKWVADGSVAGTTLGRISGIDGVPVAAPAFDAFDFLSPTTQEAGGAANTTNNRMEILAVIEGLRALPNPTSIMIVSDSQYVINTMTKNWKRNKNQDLWEDLDALCDLHKVKWTYVRGHAGHVYNERCDKLAVSQIAKYRS